MPTIYIDGKPHAIDGGQNLLEACIELGLNVPYFCWHPALGSVGACRQCAVKQYKDESDSQGRIVMSCMTPATDGIRITVDDGDSKDFRASVIEWMMTNHPHDCPVCDEGGECHLQDMTLMTGHNYRNFRFDKKTYNNQNLGPLINHEMNRCIQCYRCVRYYKDYAGGGDLDAFAAHHHVYFGRSQDGTLESEFSGNLVEVCPTGVFTDKTLKRHFTRRWDYTTAPSVCVHCALGCNITPGERYGKLRRIRNRYNRAVNGYFLCDRGRYGYEFVNSGKRPKAPLRLQRDGTGEAFHVPVTRDEAMNEIGALLKNGAKTIGIGSPRASLEANFALRVLVGAENFYLGLSKIEYSLLSTILEIVIGGPARQPGLGALKDHDAVFVLGEDLTNVAPLAALSVRQTILNQPRAESRKMGIPDWNDLAVRRVIDVNKGPLFIAAPFGGKLDDAATQTFFGTPSQLAELGFAVAHAIDPACPAADGISADTAAFAKRVADALRAAEKPLVISGPSCGSESVVRAAANVAWALCRTEKPASLYYTAHECNTTGLGLMSGGHIEGAAEAIRNGDADTLIILENDLYRRADAALVDEMLSTAKDVVVVDHLYHPTAQKASFVLPAASFAEGDGTIVNNIGRAQRMMQVYKPEGEITESWRWLRRVRTATGVGQSTDLLYFDSFIHALVDEIPAFSRILEAAPSAAFRVGGQKIPRQTHRFSGRTAMKANVAVSETAIASDPDSAFSFSMEGFQMLTPAAVMSSFWVPGWNSAQAITRFQEEVNGPLEGGDPGIRLIEPMSGSTTPYFSATSNQPSKAGQLVAIPRYHIFGSEELSSISPAIAELTPALYVMMHPDDAQDSRLQDGDIVEVQIGGAVITAPLRINNDMARACVVVPIGFTNTQHVP
ncbi:MAG: NADH-quinone oxidoreductase subunit NuoG, partial [Candidatus Hydrogenedentes bacterium]|nr:NADH-quinone oxidoreductase subunit NuoG [Candidatus Hydrogenedentota bacterium]